MDTTEAALRDRYDAVSHLVTAAKGAMGAYTTANNAARYETPEGAVDVDNRIIAAWTGHPHLRIIDNSSAFEEKLERLLHEILSFLGEPVPLPNERTFLIEHPDAGWLASQANCRKVEIVQTYLRSVPGEEVCVRQRSADGVRTYYETVKKPLDDGKLVEIEKALTQKAYLKRLSDADPTKRTLHKTRYHLTCQGHYYEIDLFPFWPDRALCEVQVSDETVSVTLPPELTVIREVTDDAAYQNVALAGAVPEE